MNNQPPVAPAILENWLQITVLLHERQTPRCMLCDNVTTRLGGICKSCAEKKEETKGANHGIQS